MTFKNLEQVHVLPVSIDKDVEQVPHPCLTNVEVLPVITGLKKMWNCCQYLLVIVPVSTGNLGGLQITKFYW